jgi:hypothetical protein
MMVKRRRKARDAMAGQSLNRSDPTKRLDPGTVLIFKPGSAAILGLWKPGDEGDPPPSPGDQP